MIEDATNELSHSPARRTRIKGYNRYQSSAVKPVTSYPHVPTEVAAHSRLYCRFSPGNMALEAARRSLYAGQWILALVFIHLATPVTANTNLTSSDNQTADAVGTGGVVPLDNDVVPKSLIAVAILACAVAIGAIIAKLVDFIHDRKSLRDDASDMSEYTRVLLKKRLAMLAFRGNKKDGEGADDEYGDGSGVKLPPELVALKFGKQWSFKANQRKLERQRSQSDIERGSSVGDPDRSGNADLLAFTMSSGQPAVANLVTTSCEVAGVSVSSLNELVVPTQAVLTSPGSPVRRVPSLTVDEMEDDVFLEEALSPHRARRTPTPSMIARVQVGAYTTRSPGSSKTRADSSNQASPAVNSQPIATQTNATQPTATQTNATQPTATQPTATQTNATEPATSQTNAFQAFITDSATTQAPAPQTPISTTAQSPAQVLAHQMSSRPKSSHTRATPKPPPSPGSWLYKDRPPSVKHTELAPVHGATPKDTSSAAPADNTPAASTATVAAVTLAMVTSSTPIVAPSGSMTTTAASGSLTSIRHEQRPESPVAVLDVPERPANPVPPSSRTESTIMSPPRTPTPIIINSKSLPPNMKEDVDHEGVLYSYDAKRPTTGGGKGRTSRFSSGKASAAFSSKSDIRKIFQSFTKTSKRPQTAKKVTSSNSAAGQGSRAGAISAAGKATADSASGEDAKRPKTAGPTGNRPVSAKPSRKITPGVRLKSAKR